MLRPWLAYRDDEDWREQALQVVRQMTIPEPMERRQILTWIETAPSFDEAGGLLYEAEKTYAPNLLNAHFPTGLEAGQPQEELPEPKPFQV